MTSHSLDGNVNCYHNISVVLQKSKTRIYLVRYSTNLLSFLPFGGRCVSISLSLLSDHAVSVLVEDALVVATLCKAPLTFSRLIRALPHSYTAIQQ